MYGHLAGEPSAVPRVGPAPAGAIAETILSVYTAFFVAYAMPFQEEIDPLAPQREAALFYGLFLRGHSAETLRRDIDVPKKLLEKLMRRHRNELAVRQKLRQVYAYRKQVLAIFEELVNRERIRERVH
jgi:hypothetical protein